MRYQVRNICLFEILTIKAAITTAADGILILFSFLKKLLLEISCESSTRKTIHMKCHGLFSLEGNNNIECHLLHTSLGILRVAINNMNLAMPRITLHLRLIFESI